MNILLTGGCGFIGSHIAIAIYEQTPQNNVIIVDNLSNSDKNVLDKIQQITGRMPKFYQIDMMERTLLDSVFAENHIDIVIHLAGLKSVNESIANPLLYYQTNINITLNLVAIMEKYKCRQLIFSSSATIYGHPMSLPITEKHIIDPIQPYGKTKAIIEAILADLVISNRQWSITALRYFNPVGAHPSGIICENPKNIPNNLFPYIIRVIKGELPVLNIFGDNYHTEDGTCIRDYIHVMDLAIGHIRAMEQIHYGSYKYYNLGCGRGVSVMEIVNRFNQYLKNKILYKISARRPGDVEELCADVFLAHSELHWIAKYTVDDCIADTLKTIGHSPNTIK